MLVKLMAQLPLLLKQMLQRMRLIKLLIMQYQDQVLPQVQEAIILYQMELQLLLREIPQQPLIFPLLVIRIMSVMRILL